MAGSRPALRRLPRVPRRVYRAWRSSLQLRVVVTTLLVSGVVVALLGFVVQSQVTRGLLSAKTDVALAEANGGLAEATGALTTFVSAPSNADAEAQFLCQLVDSLASRGSAAGIFDVFVLSTSPTRSGCGPARVEVGSIPADLRAQVTEEAVQASSYTLVRGVDQAPGRPALVIGAPVVSGASGYQIYYLFPLDNETETLSLVRRTLAVAGVVLALLLAGIAALVTRQVVTPVRVAARTAGRLAAGFLEERLDVRGRDDLARLASSFNDMAASLQRQIVRLEELSRVQRRFVSDVSHELRTPLTTVRMAADVLHAARADFPASVARSAELLQAELDRFESLLADLLEISRYDAGAADLDLTPSDVVELAQGCLAALQPLADRRGSELRLVAPGGPVLAEVDSRRVVRILRNLVGNAIEHGEGRPVEVTVAGDDTGAAVLVRDSGIGLRPGETERVFDRFWRADPSRARHSGGTGLGLSIALEDARLHGGWLQAWGEPGQGAAFLLTLPRSADAVLTSSPLPLGPAEVSS